jgi:FkbM family methyltransferase
MFKHPTKFVSYAQNAEDVVLMRGLSHLKSGFYVDIGAWHPTNDSVTKAFYDKGWSGINVEPQPKLFDAFLEQRSRDINLQVAVSNKIEVLSLWVPKYSALATCETDLLDTNIPDYAEAVEYVVEAENLDSLLSKHAKGREIHFLKIDVEGYENKVLSGTNFDKYRPLILVIEATSPHTNEPTWLDWEEKLINKGYLFAMFDGLNRFYVREESRELLPKLIVPANCLDGFITQREAILTRELDQTVAKLRELHAEKSCLSSLESNEILQEELER